MKEPLTSKYNKLLSFRHEEDILYTVIMIIIYYYYYYKPNFSEFTVLGTQKLLIIPKQMVTCWS